MIVDCGIYRDGRRVDSPSDIDGAIAAQRSRDDTFCWLGLHEPDEDELNAAAKAFGLHPLAVEDAFKAHQRPKLEAYGEVTFVVLKTLTWPDRRGALRVGELNIFVGPRFVVTVRHGPNIDLQHARHDLEERAGLLGHGPAAVLYAICDHVVDRYGEVAALLEDAVDDVEQSVFSNERVGEAAESVYRLKAHAIGFRRAVRPLGAELDPLVRGRVAEVGEEETAFFRDVADHVLRLSDQVESLDDLLSSVLSAHLARVGVQQNDDARRISAWVAIAAVPTLLAGIYGMNFEHMPELRWWWGYYAVLGLMAVICVLLYLRLRRAGWL